MTRLGLGILLGAGCLAGCASQGRPAAALPPYDLYRLAPRRHDAHTRPARPRPGTEVRGAPNGAWLPGGSRMSSRWTHIVLHHSATARGGAGLFDKYHRETNGWDELGYHFVIGNGTDTPDGLIETGPRWHKQKHGAHCKTPDNYFNEHGIGICLVGDFTRSRPTRRQLVSLNRLLRFLCRQCGIGLERVTTHGTINKNTVCPGRHLRLSTIRRGLAGRATASSAGSPRAPGIARPSGAKLRSVLNRSRRTADGYKQPISNRRVVR